MSKATKVNDRDFRNHVLESDVPVLVDFYADWCGPCRAMAPVMEEIAEEAAGEFRVAKLDIDENQELAEAYEIQSIPTMLLFAGGKVLERWTGIEPKAFILNGARRKLSAEAAAPAN